MELKTYIIRDENGDIVPYGEVFVYNPGTTTPTSEEIQDGEGNVLTNPFTANMYGIYSVSLPNGSYTIENRIPGSSSGPTRLVKFFELNNEAEINAVAAITEEIVIVSENINDILAAPQAAIDAKEDAEAAAVLAHSLPVVNISVASTDMTQSHAVQWNRFTFNGAKTLNVQTNASAAIAVNSQIHIRNVGTGDLTIVPEVGVTVNLPADGTLVLGQGMYATLIKVDADEWDLLGYTVLAS